MKFARMNIALALLPVVAGGAATTESAGRLDPMIASFAVQDLNFDGGEKYGK